MISPEALLKLAYAYELAAYAALLVPNEYDKMSELIMAAMKEIWAGEKVRLAGRFKLQEGLPLGKLERFKERAQHFIDAGNAFRDMVKIFDRSPKEYYQPEFLAIMEQTRPSVAEFMKKARISLRRNQLTMDDLRLIAGAVRRVNGAFMGRQVLRPLAEIQDIISEQTYAPSKKRAPSKPRKPTKQQLQEVKERVQKGEEVALGRGVTVRKRRESAQEPEAPPPEEYRPTPKPKPKPAMTQEEIELAELLEMGGVGDEPGEDWLAEWEKMKTELAERPEYST